VLENIFPLQIYTAEFPDYDNIKQSLLDDVVAKFDVDREQYAGHRLMAGDALTLSGSKPFQYRHLHRVLKNQEVVTFINKHIKLYWDGLGYNKGFTPDITHMWANLTRKGGNITHHNHSPFEIAGVFYVNATPEMGCLALVNPNEMILGRLPYYTQDETYQGRYFFDHVVEPKPGKLVLFPGWLYHKTQPNTTDEERVILGINSGSYQSMIAKLAERLAKR
jgi:uncharacterized protein (TIGR02466 family)